MCDWKQSTCRYVMPRPEGRRCLVISSHQMTISRHRNGSILHRFPSVLPNGSRASMAGSGDDFCILDCIFHEPNSTYYIIDMMCWKGYALYDCSAEFRLFWVQGKLAECASGSAQDQARYPFVPVPAYTCSPGDMIAKVYACTAPALQPFAVQRLHLVCNLSAMATSQCGATCRGIATSLFKTSAISARRPISVA